MAKLVDGKVLRRADGKVMKPEGWQPPNLAQFLE
jgi:predicted HAD superfamily Cof-like phosphohydrolase